MSDILQGNLSDTFLDSFNKGLGFAHQAEQQNQVNQAQQMAAQLHYMQSLKIAHDLMEQEKPKYEKVGNELVKITPTGEVSSVFKSEDKKPSESEANWIATINDPNTLPGEKLIAQAKLNQSVQNKKDIAKESRMALGDVRTVNVTDKQSGITQPLSINEYKTLREQDPARYTAPQYDTETIQKVAEAKQAGGSRSSNIRTAYEVFNKEAPELISIRKKVQDKGLLPEGIKDVGTFNQWLGKKTNDPDVAELQKKTKLLADTLQRTIGGTQGGQWAFEVAADILDPTYSTPAFSRILQSHTKTFYRMAEEYKNFGKKDISTPFTEEKTSPINISIPKGVSRWVDVINGKKTYYDLPQEKAESFYKKHPNAMMIGK